MLLLFDIDGTLLLKATAEHRDAIHAAVRDIHGVDVPDAQVEAAGRTDLAIARSILELAGLDPARIEERAEELAAAAVAHYERLVPADLVAHVAPGVPEVLDELATRGDATIALLTGNLEAIARAKLAAAGIGGYFAPGQGAFGSDHEDREALPDVARRRAGTGGAPYPREYTVVIGDTPRDIACARAGGVHVVAIATGPFPADALRDADVVVEHALELPGALAAFRPQGA
jgi:phosphoglycolate phosphatase-like HAD superfamily hydrolase